MDRPHWDRWLGSCEVVERHTVRAFEKKCDLIVLSPLDVTITNLPLSVSSLLLYRTAVDRTAVLSAAQQLANKYPVLCGRYTTGREALTIECNNAGMPLTFVHWPEGSLSLFPEAVCYHDWHTELPATVQLPESYFVDNMNGFDTVFKGEPLFKLRLTTLGDGGCILSLTAHHPLVGGARIGYLQLDIANACKGLELEPVKVGLQRDLAFPESLAKILPQYKDILLPPAADRQAGVPGHVNGQGGGDAIARVSFRDRWKRLFGSSLAEFPAWPIGPSRGPQTYSFVCIEIPGSDLTSLQDRSMQQQQCRLSKNDVLLGLVWVLRCIIAKAPFPGQVGSCKDFGAISIDLAINNVGGAFGDLFGNTAAGCIISLPQHGSLGGDDTDNRDAALLTGVAVAAAANRQALQEWRKGGPNFQAMLQNIAAPDRLEREKALLDKMKAEGKELRCVVTNLAVFGGGRQEALDTLNCGTGAPVQFFVHFDPARERWTGVIPSGNGDGVFLQTMVPSNIRELLQEAAFFETLAPNARYRGLHNGIPVSRAGNGRAAQHAACL